VRILHLLSQRPSLTGKQCVVVGVPADDPTPPIGELTSEYVRPLRFGSLPLDFPVPGMSDVMPYPSTRFSDLDEEQVSAYRRAWTEHLRPILDDFQPDLIHSHHVWLMSALLKDVAPEIPIVTHCHATGLRQMELCPHLASDVRRGCSRNDAFIVLHAGHAEQLRVGLGIDPACIHVVGAGYREDLFHCRSPHPRRKPALLYIGKYSAAKGVPWLLDAFERVLTRNPAIRLHVAGGGAGEEADALRSRMDRMAPAVVQHGQLAQPELADLWWRRWPAAADWWRPISRGLWRSSLPGSAMGSPRSSSLASRRWTGPAPMTCRPLSIGSKRPSNRPSTHPRSATQWTPCQRRSRTSHGPKSSIGSR